MSVMTVLGSLRQEHHKFVVQTGMHSDFQNSLSFITRLYMKNERKGGREGGRKEGQARPIINKIQGWYGLREKEPLLVRHLGPKFPGPCRSLPSQGLSK